MTVIPSPRIEARQTVLDALAREFGLSAAEMRVARVIARGVCAKSAARELNISYHTVRNHLKSIFEKTGTHRQSALAILVVRMEQRQ